MEKINTLVNDIYNQVKQRNWFDGQISQEFGNEVARRLAGQFADKKAPTLRLSQMGPKCPKALWHSIYTPEEAEALPPWAEIKYSYGHIVEAWVIALAKASGHNVVGEQDELRVDGIVGHRDCVIDGCLVDVKSSSSPGMAKFRTGSIQTDDLFGYLDQLDGYLIGSMDDPLVEVKDRAYLLVVDKQLGHMVLYEHKFNLSREQKLHDRISYYRKIIASDVPPACECGTIPEGKSGNIRLDIKASYSPFKYSCFPHLRTFIPKRSENGFVNKTPIYLTHVVRVPDMQEVDRYGRPIHQS